MRFCDFFISYKIGLKGIKNSIPFTQLPLYRKIAIILIFVVALSEMLLLFFNQSTLSIILLILALLFLSIFIFIDSMNITGTFTPLVRIEETIVPD